MNIVVLNQSYRRRVSTDRLNLSNDSKLAVSLEGESGSATTGKDGNLHRLIHTMTMHTYILYVPEVKTIYVIELYKLLPWLMRIQTNPNSITQTMHRTLHIPIY